MQFGRKLFDMMPLVQKMGIKSKDELAKKLLEIVKDKVSHRSVAIRLGQLEHGLVNWWMRKGKKKGFTDALTTVMPEVKDYLATAAQVQLEALHKRPYILHPVTPDLPCKCLSAGKFLVRDNGNVLCSCKKEFRLQWIEVTA
jgi:hypothetical protein